jgi:signal transduction histidine kinase
MAQALLTQSIDFTGRRAALWIPALRPADTEEKRESTVDQGGRELDVVYRLNRLLAAGADYSSLLRTLLHEALVVTRGCGGQVLLLERDRRILRFCVGEGQKISEVEGAEISADDPPWVDATREGRVVHAPLDTMTTLVLPLLARGDVLGVLALQGLADEWMQPPKGAFLETLADIGAHALHHAAFARDLDRQKQALGTLIEVGQEIAASLEPDEVLWRVTRQAARLMRAKICSVMLIDEAEHTLRIRATYGASRTYTQRPPLDIHASLIGEVARTGTPIAVIDVREDPHYQLVEMARAEGLCSLLGVPLKTLTRVIGVLCVYTAERRRFRQEEVEFLSALAAQSATAIENARLYQAMLDTQEQLRQSERLASLGSMAAGLAHEVRNPLHTMQLLVYAMWKDYPPPSPLSRDLEVIQNEISRLALLVEQCLDVARPQAPEVKPQKLQEILDETLLLVSAEANRRGIWLRKHWARQLPVVWVDGPQLKPVFLNVLLNALQAMGSGGTVDMSIHADETTITTVVRDQGAGISPEVQAQLFTPFFTTKPKGTGLGLSIARRIIEGHRGRIRVTSQPGEGTTVRIKLPLRAETTHEKDLGRR